MRYEPASAHPVATGCQTGTRALASAISEVYPEAMTMRGPYGCWNPRRIEGSSSWSLHAEGRAVDIGTLERIDQGLGWELACTLVAHRKELGTMRVIYDSHVWSTEHPDQWKALATGVNQHHDHVHVEQFWKNATMPAQVVRPQYVTTLVRARHDWAAKAPAP